MAFRDDLDFNPFYKALQNKFSGRFREAEQNCWLICVPHTDSIRKMTFTENFLDFHILRPSPYFKGHYLSSDKEGKFSVELENNYLKTPTENIKVLSEELGYNDEMKKYTILIVEKPLHPQFQKKVSSADGSTKKKDFHLTNPREYLLELQCHHDAMAKVDKKVQFFNKNYMVLPNFLEHAKIKYLEVLRECKQLLFDSHPILLEEEDPGLALEITLASESYVGSQTYAKVFPEFQKRWHSEDSWIHAKLVELHRLGLTASHMGVPPPLDSLPPFTDAISILRKLDSHQSPTLKLLCLKATLDSITETVNNFQNPLLNISLAQKMNTWLTSDNYLCLLVEVLSQTQPQHLAASLHYIEYFCPSLLHLENFSHVTFKAALEYIKMERFAFLKSSQSKEEAGDSSKDATPSPKIPNFPSSMGDGTQESKAKQTLSPLDKKLDRITRKILASSEFESLAPSGTPARSTPPGPNNTDIAKLKDENLGGFLSKMRAGISFGKQS